MDCLIYYTFIAILIAFIVFIIKFIRYPDKDLYKSIKNLNNINIDYSIPKKNTPSMDTRL